MSYLNGRVIEKMVVPVHCESEQGTAFFISDRHLLTARHVVQEHFEESAVPAPIYIVVAEKKIFCTGEELSITDNAIDLARLTIVSEEDYQPFCEPLKLLSDKYEPNMPLHVYGYPREVAMGCNLVDIKAKNGLEISGGAWHDRALIREDSLTIHNYDGLSGAPVVSISGRVVGVIVLQINETLNYLSISKVKEHLSQKGISYETNWEQDDVTTMGMGRSLQFCEKAVATVHGRYMPELHQGNKELELLLEYVSDKRHLDESLNKAKALAETICKLSDEKQRDLQGALKTGMPFTMYSLMTNGGDFLRRCYDYFKDEGTRKYGGWDRTALDEKVYELKEEDLERIKSAQKKNLCLVGKAGSGKTHSLCHFAINSQDKANIYLFFGTDFTVNQSAIEHVRSAVCEEMSFMDFNAELKKRGRYAVVVIDAINEGLGCVYWDNHLGALRTELDKYDHFRLIISVRKPFDNEVKDLSNNEWHTHQIEGFEDKDRAIDAYFRKYDVDRKYRNLNLAAFKNPLFLKMFCETFHSMTEYERNHVNKRMLYKRYVAIKNEKVSKEVDEDQVLNIADKYLSKLANYSVYYGHFNPISRSKARQYAKRMAPYRLWSNDLLHACLTSNLLLDDRSHTGEPAVMFEYENLGDYYKADELLHSKMDVKRLLIWIDEERKYLQRHEEVPSEKFRNAIKALFDCWYYRKAAIYDERILQKGGELHDLYSEYLLESDVPYKELVAIMLKLDNDRINPLQLIQRFDEITYEETLQIHEKLKSYPTVGSRDLMWTNFVNQMYEYGEYEYLENILNNHNLSFDENEDGRKYLIGITWMLSSSHPKYRAILIRKIKSILQIHQSLSLWLIGLFEDVNDPYVLGGLYCAICGIVLPSRDKELTSSIARHIYTHYYEEEKDVPQDLIVRQWTLKIIERAYYLDNTCDCWKLIKTPFTPQLIDTTSFIDYENIHREIFGIQHGSLMLYESMFGFEDFNRYIIGTNSRHQSGDYFIQNEKGEYEGVSLRDIMAEMAYYIQHVFGWNEKLGSLDNGKYSPNRLRNEKERIGKKFQWLAWHRVNAHLMDACRVTREQYFYNDTAEEKDLVQNPYPWHCSEVSRFDPTLDAEQKRQYHSGLIGIEEQPIIGKEMDDWIDNRTYLPAFRWLTQNEDGTEYVMLMGYDTAKDKPKETFLFSNACFVKQEDAEKFAKWAKKKNFYGRWMPERQGATEFLWSDYPWADSYKSSLIEDDGYRTYDCPCKMLLSYEAQLQENWEGIAGEEEFLTTAYMPCVEMMEQMGLYCSEDRGIVKAEDGSIAAINVEKGNGINGLFVRRVILNEYLKQNGYVMFYYVLGEKWLRKSEHEATIKDISAAYQYNLEGDIKAIQPMQVMEREVPRKKEVNKKKRRAELQKKNHEEGLTTREMIELMNLGIEDDES